MAQLLRLSADRCDAECLHPAAVRPILDRTLDSWSVRATAEWLRLLADPTRLRILQALSLTVELCACDLALLLGISVSALSHQLRLLRERGVVTRRKAGRIAYFSLADEHVRHVLADAIAHAAESARVSAAPSGDFASADTSGSRTHHHLSHHAGRPPTGRSHDSAS